MNNKEFIESVVNEMAVVVPCSECLGDGATLGFAHVKCDTCRGEGYVLKKIDRSKLRVIE